MNECFDSVLKKGDKEILCKSDMMRRMGFGIKWRNWIEQCYGTAFFSILLNGALVDYFFYSRGLRRGDPLSPSLFLIVTEAFSAILSKDLLGGLLEGVEVGGTE